MSSKRKQLNIRLTEEGEARLGRLLDRMRNLLGMPLSQSDVVNAGLAELERRYPPGCDVPAAAQTPLTIEPTKRGRPQKKEKE